MNEHLDETEPDLPELQNADLSEAELDALFADLAACAQLQSVRLKARARVGADDSTVTLDEAQTLLKSGKVQGVQIRYVYQERLYSDTLLRGEKGFRLIRR